MQQVLILILLGLLTFNTGCSESDDQKKLGEAQACLDKVPQSPIGTTVSEANKCMSYIASVDSPQADGLRCSIGFLAGGITTTKLIEAIKKIDNGNDAQEVFMGLLVFNGRTPGNSSIAATGTIAIDNVEKTAGYCNASGVKGLMYLGNFAVAGTAIVKSIRNDSETAFWEDPTFTDTNEITSALTDCASGATSCDPSQVGTAIIALSSSYCIGKEDDEQCQLVQDAINQGGGDASAVGDAFYKELFCSKEENKSNPVCTP